MSEEAIQVQLSALQKDLGRVEANQQNMATTMQQIQIDMARTKPGLGAWVRDLAMIAPMYALVIDLIVRGIH